MTADPRARIILLNGAPRTPKIKWLPPTWPPRLPHRHCALHSIHWRRSELLGAPKGLDALAF